MTSVTTNAMDNLSGVSTRVVMLVTEGLFSTAVMTLMVFLFDARVGLLIAAGLGIYFFFNCLLRRASRQITQKKMASDTAVVERVLEFIKGIAEVKACSLTGKYNRRLQQAIAENVAANTEMELKLLPLMFLQSAVARLIDVAVVALALTLYIGGRMDLLNCIMLAVCSFLLTEGLEQAGTQSSLLRVVDTCVNQASDILNLPTMDISGEKITPLRHDLRAEDVRFSYGKPAHYQRHNPGNSRKDHHGHRGPLGGRQDHPVPPAFPVLGCGRWPGDPGRPRRARLRYGQPDAEFQLRVPKRISVPRYRRQ